jgi:hypothetical protein
MTTTNILFRINIANEKTETIEIKISSDNSWTQQRTTTTNILLIMKK